MSDTPSRPNRWAVYWPELAWVGFAIGNLVAMVHFADAETVPFHFIWVSLTLLYGLRTWARSATLTVLGVTSLVSGGVLLWAVTHSSAGYYETTEVPLMGLMFLAMVWHAQRRQAAMEASRNASERALVHERERDLLRDASHELRTPITIARGHAELIRSAHGGNQTARDADVIVDELGRLERISNRLLILAAAAYPQFLRRVPLDVEPLLIDAARRWSAAEPRFWVVSATLDGTVLADEERLVSSLDALIENAVKATQAGDRIEIAARVEGGQLEIAVSDAGPGIAAEHQERIFEPFSRADSGRSRKRGGTGLGLPIVRAIAEAHGGTVGIDSAPGRGATFTMRLPGFEPSDLTEGGGPFDPDGTDPPRHAVAESERDC